jgi:phosphopantetheinyl transferase
MIPSKSLSFLLFSLRRVSLLPLNAICLDSFSFFSLANDSSKWPGIDQMRSACLGWILLDIETISSIGEYLLTPREAARAMRLGPRRRRDFTAARVALKKLARQLDLAKENRPDREIETLGPDDVRPCIAKSGIYCSVSHSTRLVVAVAHRHPVGVDLEMVSEKATRIWSLFMSPRERDLVLQSGLSAERTAARAWTIKEAAAKALGLHLFQAIYEVEVVSVGEEEGVMSYQKKTYPVTHAEGNGYVISLITCDGH